jgi:predicted DNA-binding WGR domain protein
MGFMDFATQETTTLELRLIDPEANRFRLYTIAEGQSLFGEFCLFITWGRIGHLCRTRIEIFTERDALVRRRKELLARRRRHGYRIMSPGEFTVNATNILAHRQSRP